jgi:hypothetical protein
MENEEEMFDEVLPELIEWKYAPTDSYAREKAYKLMLKNLIKFN